MIINVFSVSKSRRSSCQDNLLERLYAERWWLLTIVLTGAVVMRFFGLGAQSIWVDEGYSIWFSEQSWQYLWSEVPKFENHPPYYFMLLKACRMVFGDSEVALRLPSAILSVLVVWVVFAAGRDLGSRFDRWDSPRMSAEGWMLGLLAAGLAILSETQIVYGQEARPYAFATFAGAVMLLGGLRIVGRTDPKPIDYAYLGAGMLLTSWSHSLGIVLAGLTGLFLMVWWACHKPRDWRVFGALAATAGVVVLLLVPHINNILIQYARDYQDFWLEAPDRRHFVLINLQIIGQAGLPGNGLLLSLAIAGLLTLVGIKGLWQLTRGWQGGTWSFAYLIVIPLGFWLFVVAYTYLKTPVLVTRTLIYLQPFAFLTLAAGLFAWVPLRLVFGGVVATYFALGLVNMPTVINFPRPYRDFVVQIADSNDPTAPVLAVPDISALCVEYYIKQFDLDLDLWSVPNDFPLLDFRGLPDMVKTSTIDAEHAEELVARLADKHAFWVIERNYSYFDPKGYLHAEIEKAGFHEVVRLSGDYKNYRKWRNTPLGGYLVLHRYERG